MPNRGGQPLPSGTRVPGVDPGPPYQTGSLWARGTWLTMSQFSNGWGRYHMWSVRAAPGLEHVLRKGEQCCGPEVTWGHSRSSTGDQIKTRSGWESMDWAFQTVLRSYICCWSVLQSSWLQLLNLVVEAGGEHSAGHCEAENRLKLRGFWGTQQCGLSECSLSPSVIAQLWALPAPCSEAQGVIYGGFDGGFSGVMLAAGWNVPEGLYSRLFKMLLSICKPDILRVTSGKRLRIFLLLVEGKGIWTEQKRFVLCGWRSRYSRSEASVLGGSVCSNRFCF